MIVWSRLLRHLIRNRRIPYDQDAKVRYGTWGWLTGRNLWKPDPNERPCAETAPGLHPLHTHTCVIKWPHVLHECPCGAYFETPRTTETARDLMEER